MAKFTSCIVCMGTYVYVTGNVYSSHSDFEYLEIYKNHSEWYTEFKHTVEYMHRA